MVDNWDGGSISMYLYQSPRSQASKKASLADMGGGGRRRGPGTGLPEGWGPAQRRDRAGSEGRKRFPLSFRHPFVGA